MKDMEKFFTRGVAQEGRKVPLEFPDGSESPHWIRLRGIDSDAYTEALALERKTILEANESGEVGDAVVSASRTRLIARLVAGWSFSDDPSLEDIVAFLEEAPQIRERLNELAADRKYFFADTGKDSKSTPNGKPSSPSPSQKKAS